MRIEANGHLLNYRDDGPKGAPAVVFAHALGTDLTLWDEVVAALPDGLRIIRYDLRGHGESTVPRGPYAMGQLVGDAEALLDALEVRDAVFVGISLGGMIAQGLAIKRLDQIRALVLSNTAARIGIKSQWEARIAQARTQGLGSLVAPTLDRWFGPAVRKSDVAAHWGQVLAATDTEGYAGCCAAISGTDFYTPTSGLRLPCLGIAGSFDGATPPDLVGETVGLIPGSKMHLMRRSGHLPCVDAPDDYAAALTTFLGEIGHV